MRKLQEHIVKGKEIFIGLEDSKTTWRVCVRSEGMLVHETRMPAQYDGLLAYLTRQYPDCQQSLIYESGFAGFGLHDQLTDNGVTCIVTPAHTVTQAKVSRIKTDTRDARRLAMNLEHGDYIACHVPDKERREDRQISRTREQIKHKIIRVKNQIRRFLDFHGLNGDLPAGAWTNARYLALPKLLHVSDSLQIAFDELWGNWVWLEQSKKRLTEALRTLCEKPRYQVLVASKQSLPGIGPLTAIRLTLEWGDLSRFPTGKHFASYTGLTSREYSTGATTRRGRITGSRSAPVRSWLIQCAWRALRLDPVLLDKYQAVWRNSGSKKKAIVAVARKMAVRMRARELTEQPYVNAVIE